MEIIRLFLRKFPATGEESHATDSRKGIDIKASTEASGDVATDSIRMRLIPSGQADQLILPPCCSAKVGACPDEASMNPQMKCKKSNPRPP